MKDNTVIESISQLIERIVISAQAKQSDKHNGLSGLVLGSMGCGKSSAFFQAAAELTEQTGEPWGVIDIRALLYDPVELKGLQSIDSENDFTKLMRPDWARDMDPNGNYLIVFEEVTKALPSVQSALMQIILDRHVADFEFGKNWVPYATGNLSTDRSGDIPMPAALRDRFWIVNVQADADAWCEYAADKDLLPEITSFVRSQPQMLSNWDGSQDPLVFSTPRAFEFLNNVLQQDNDPARWAIPYLGQEAGVKFAAHCDIMSQLPDYRTVIDNPAGSPVFEDKPTAFYMAAIMAYYATKDDAAAVVTYAKRNDHEVAMSMVNEMVRRHPETQTTEAYIGFIAEYDPQQSI